MKKGVIGLSLLLIFSLIPAYSATPPKAGSVCSKQGVTKSYQGKRYTCVKSGKKLVWNKGVAVTKPTPSPIPTPIPSPSSTPTTSPSPSPSPTTSPTPSPTPTPTPSQTFSPSPIQTVKPPNQMFWKFKIVNGVLFRNIEATGEWTTTDGRVDTEFDSVRARAWNQINSVTRAQVTQDSVTYFVGPKVSPEMEASYKLLIERSLKYFSSWMTAKVPLYVHIYTEQDRDYFKQSMQIYVNGEEDYKRLEIDLRNYDGIGSNWSPSGGVTGGALKTDPNSWINFATFAMDSEIMPEGLLMYMIPHEISHHWQFSVMQPLLKRSNSERSACNFFEGSAVLLGSSIGVDSIGWYSDEMDVITRRVSKDNPQFNPATPNDIVEELMRMSSTGAKNALGCTTGYTLGALAYEWLVAEKGITVLQDLAEAFNKTSSVSDGIKLVTGWSDREFYERSSDYVFRAWQRAVSLKP